MNEGINVLSLFDGMSCGMIAIERSGIKVKNYYASEIDKYAIIVSKANYPQIKQVGDIENWREWDIDWGSIDLVIGGSPCQGFSFAGKGLAFDDPRSRLFFAFLDILNHIKNLNKSVKYMLENVKMKAVYLDKISELMGVTPVLINSSLVSAQNRNRYYWTNISKLLQPKDNKIGWGDIRQNNVADNFYYSEAGLAWIKRHGERKNKQLTIWGSGDKCQMIEASHFKNYSSQRFFGIEDVKGLRYITPTECERAQTVPDNYTNHVSNTQRYRMLGNGWNVDTIVHIFKGLK